jgi:c-di-GMP-binding flagellar brake protein YcgR
MQNKETSRVDIETNQIIEVKIKHEDRVMSAFFSEINKEGMCITYPLEEETGTFRPLTNGMNLFITYTSKKSSCCYQFPTQVVGRKKDNIPLIILKTPKDEEVKRIQRREFFRVPAALPITLIKETEKDVQKYPAQTIDISGNGILFACKAAANWVENETVKGTMTLPVSEKENRPISFDAKIIRTNIKDDEQRHSLMFKGLTAHDQETIIQFCVRRQMELRKKMKL